MDLKTPLREASRVYKTYANRLEKLGIKKIEDFLYHIPFRYDDYSLISKIENLQAGETATIRGVVKEIKNEYTSRWKKIQKAKIADKTGEINVTWFNQSFLTKMIKKGDKISLSGKVVFFKNTKVLQSPDYEIIYTDNLGEKTIHTGRLVPVYPETKGLSSKWLRRQIYNLLKFNQDKFVEYLPSEVIRRNNLIKIETALNNIHFPQNLNEANAAKERLAFDELLIMQLNALKRKDEWQKNKPRNSFQISLFKEKINEFLKSLTFELTNAQKRVIKEIFTDFSLKKPMNRLLEGEVGSGKTVIATIAMYLTYLNNYQSILMAPTEILAKQHYKTVNKLLSPLGVKIRLLTSSTKKTVSLKKTNILIGTHAVLYQKNELKNVGLVVIDEQQRFGVKQRSILRKTGESPHVLTMTATPIPRTVALTMYGDLDISFLDEMPVGRKKIKTWLVAPEKREGAYNWIEREIINNQSQVFIICPLIEESENLTAVKAVTKEFQLLKKRVFPKLKLGLLHGRMKSKEKDEVLKQFKNKKIDILVSTPVVEVGIDIPNATIMLIEQSERFGLSQLHQLRGRVGRGDKQAYCLLFTSSKNEKTIERLKSMEMINFGPDLAELDLKLRGPGQIYGTLQHGIPALKIASFSNFSLIRTTKNEAIEIIKNIEKYSLLKLKMTDFENENISPD